MVFVGLENLPVNNLKRFWIILGLYAAVSAAAWAAPLVPAAVETDPVSSPGDAADDPSVWIHPRDPGNSCILATDKKYGLVVYDLAGKQIDSLSLGRANNVDLCYNFPLAGKKVDLIATGVRDKEQLKFFTLDPNTRKLIDITAPSGKASVEPYGCCLGRSPKTGKFYFIVNSKKGEVGQYELFDKGGKVAFREVRRFAVGGSTEGCVVDYVTGDLYIGEELKAIWKYSIEPETGDKRVMVDSEHFVPYVEGLTIYYADEKTGYLLASSQGDSSYSVYRREGKNEYLGSFRIGREGIREVLHTDGIDVSSVPLGKTFPKGLFVAQDSFSDEGNQNFKLVPWERIAESFKPALAVETGWSLRDVGK